MIGVEILTIGSELLRGTALNTNSKFLSERLSHLGIRVDHHSTCDDQVDVIVETLKTAFSRADLILVTGGLGPTPDDVTREAISKFFFTKLFFFRRGSIKVFPAFTGKWASGYHRR